MKSLIWKELRENFHWAALPVLLLAIITLIAGPPPVSEFLTADWLLCVALFSAACGAAMGFLQVIFEARDDKRSLLLHRPISRSRIFLAKVITGVALYLLSVGLPFTWSVVGAAMPGHFAGPFRWGTALPWLADILTGVVYYFAGMLAAQREARWYGSRGLSLAAAFCCTIVAWALPEFWQALVAIGIFGTFVGVAAWGSFYAGGAYAPQPRLGKVALAGTFLAGLLVLSVVAKAAIGAWLGLNAPSRYYTLDRHGRLLLIQSDSEKLPVVTDVEGHPLSELKGKGLDRSAIREMEAPVSDSPWPRSDSYRNRGRYFVSYTNSTTPGDEHWFYVPDQGRLLGYENESRRFLGSIGPDGFVAAGAAPRERFRGELLSYPSFLFDAGSPAYLGFANGVYTVDFARRAARALFTPPAGERILSTGRLRDETQKTSLAIIATDKSVHALNEAGEPMFSAPLVYDRESYGVVRVGRFEDPRRFFVAYDPSWYLKAGVGKTMRSNLVEYEIDDASGSKEGREIARRTMPSRILREPTIGQALFGLATSPLESALLVGVPRYLVSADKADGGGAIQPLALLPVAAQYFIPGAGMESAPAGRAGTAFVALALLSAAGCGIACFVWTRRHALPGGRCCGWALCGVLFGWLGLLLLLAVQEWPARVRCGSCARERRVDRDSCEHCGAPHAAPATDGTEIFESTTEEGDALPTALDRVVMFDGGDRS